jgi:hypothetical protein
MRGVLKSSDVDGDRRLISDICEAISWAVELRPSAGNAFRRAFWPAFVACVTWMDYENFVAVACMCCRFCGDVAGPEPADLRRSISHIVL